MAQAEVRLPHLFTDHAVLQREEPIRVWGWADPGEQVRVVFRRQEATATADALGRWSTALRPEAAGGPDTLTVRGTNTLTVNDVLVGDVWFASGQSNMEMPLRGFPGSAVLKNGAAEIAAAAEPHLRLLRFPHTSSPYEQRDIDAAWTLSTPRVRPWWSSRRTSPRALPRKSGKTRQHGPPGKRRPGTRGTRTSSRGSRRGCSTG